MPDDELFVGQEVRVNIPDRDRPGRPISRVVCAICGEGINDRREMELNGLILCRACAQGSYYHHIGDILLENRKFDQSKPETILSLKGNAVLKSA
jgi:hypothetical protein